MKHDEVPYCITCGQEVKNGECSLSCSAAAEAERQVGPCIVCGKRCYGCVCSPECDMEWEAQQAEALLEIDAEERDRTDTSHLPPARE